jgi:hypothetical protein
VVYLLGEEGEEAQPVLRQRIAGSALGWTPSLDRCLERGGRYAWSVRALGPKEESEWSRPNLFRVASAPSAVEFEEALEVVRTYLAARGEAGPKAATDEGAESPAETDRASAEAPTPLAPPGTQLSIDGNVDAVSFSGSGAMLTSLDPANLSAGIADISISGNAVTATEATHASTAADLVCSDCIGTAEIDSTGLDADLLDGLDSTVFAPTSHDHLDEVWFGNTGNGLKVDFFTNDQFKAALWGRMTAATAGLFSAAVRGENLALTSGVGIWGSDAGNGIGGLGTTQTGVGIFGSASDSGGTAVWGSAAATNGVNYGVRGETSSPSGFAGYFTGRTHIAGPLGIGTTSPAWPLSILGDQAVAQLVSNANTNGSVLELRNTALLPTFLGAVNFSDGFSTPGQIAYGGDGEMHFRAGNAERMSIGATGLLLNVGVRIQGAAALEDDVSIDGDVTNRLGDNGLVKAWARVSSGGTVLSCWRCNTSTTETRRVAAGEYIVSFSPLGTDIESRPRLAVLDLHVSVGGFAPTGQVHLASNFGNDGVQVFTQDSSGASADRDFTVFIF